MARTAADFVQTQVADDGEEPGRKLRGGFVPGGGFIDLDKDVLSEVLGFGGVTEHASGHVYHRLLVFVHQFSKSGPVALLYAQHQGGIGVILGRHTGWPNVANTGKRTRLEENSGKVFSIQCSEKCGKPG